MAHTDPQESVWPPPPDVANPLAEHDEFLTARLRAPAANPPLSRLRLVRELRDATGLDLRQCLAVVNDYCDRHAIFPQRRGLALWLSLLPSLFQIGLSAGLIVSQIVLGRELAAAHTRATRHLLLRERIAWDGLLLCLAFVVLVMSLIGYAHMTRWQRRQAEDARKKVSP
ncbi:MAG: hypothetical protein JO250_16635 [Armatimonadetes bacterium]|nr:hypothetical protein [Armatimonadota bacterium]